MTVVGLLALQGCVEHHRRHIESLGVNTRLIRYPEDCSGIAGYIIPGGESSTMLKLISANGLDVVLIREWQQKPVWGICAGAILIANNVRSPAQKSFALMDYNIVRNAYGSQIMSRCDQIDDYNVAFIRAPIIEYVGSSVTVLAYHNSIPTWVRNDMHMATTFHPELNNCAPSPMHTYYVKNFLGG